MYRCIQFVILSERSESKDLRTNDTIAAESVRGSFDFGLRPPLRMTDFWCGGSVVTMTIILDNHRILCIMKI